MTRWIPLALACTGVVASRAGAQVGAPERPSPQVTISLADAIAQARQQSPTYRQATNDAGPAGWQVRNAYGSLVPALDVSSSVAYVGSGSTQFAGNLVNETSATVTSSYNVSLSWTLNGATLTAPGQQKANQHAVSADIRNAESQLVNDIKIQYLTVLQAEAQTDAARQQVIRNEDFRALAQARYDVGQVTILDVRQAEVTKGQSDVALLRARQTEREAKLELFRRMGAIPNVPLDGVALSDSFPVTPVSYQLSDLLAMAEEQNPQLGALRARESASSWGVRSARSRYLPSLSFRATWSGFAQQARDGNFLVNRQLQSALQTAQNCDFQNQILMRLTSPIPGAIRDCNDFAGLDATGQNLLPEIQSQILDANDVFPFQFRSQPFQASVTISLPIFNNFSRELQVSQAAAAREDAAEAVRARQLALRTDVESRYLALQTAFEAIAVQEANQRTAREQLRLARDRFRVGSGNALEVSDAQSAVQRAESDYVVAVYDYHRAIAALEFAIGRPLR